MVASAAVPRVAALSPVLNSSTIAAVAPNICAIPSQNRIGTVPMLARSTPQ
jgi:hypothetical protein